MMTPDRWQKIKEVFHAALERQSNDRAAFLDQACAGDEELRWEVETLLVEHQQPDSFIDRPAFEVAAELLTIEQLSSEAGQSSDTVCNIWVAPDAVASRAKQITFGSASRGDGLYGLSWTADGKLVYDSFVFNNEAVFMMKADGTDSMQMTGGDYIAGTATATLDGRYIVFTSIRASKMTIWRIDIDGNNPKQLTDTVQDAQPHCSPDGKWVFYVSTREGKWMLYKVPIDGGESIRLFDQSCAFPAVSPDGRLVALPYIDEQVKARRVGIISSETGQLLKSFDLGSYWNVLRWTHDGRAVAYIKTEGDVSNIWAQPLDGGKPVRLTDFKSDLIFNFAWSNDGKQLAVARGSETSDAVMIRDIR